MLPLALRAQHSKKRSKKRAEQAGQSHGILWTMGAQKSEGEDACRKPGAEPHEITDGAARSSACARAKGKIGWKGRCRSDERKDQAG
jgi:hypothetical protein